MEKWIWHTIEHLEGNNLTLVPNQIHEELPRFCGNNVISIEEHLDLFWKLVDELGIEHEDACMRTLTQSIERDAH